MARIPRIDPKVTPVSPGGGVAQIDPRQAATTGNIMSAAGSTLGEIGVHLEKAQTLAETTAAQNQYDIEAAKIEAEAANDPDASADNLKKYTARLDKARQDASGQITVPLYREQFSGALRKDSEISKIKIGGEFRRKSINKALADTQVFAQNQNRKIVNSRTQLEADMYIKGYDAHIDRLTEAGYLDPNEAQTKKIAFKKNSMLDRGYYEGEQNPDYAIAQAMKGDDGAYSHLDAGDRKKVLNHAQEQKRRQDAEARSLERIKRQETTHELMVLSNNGLLKGELLEEKFLTKQISNSTYRTLQDNITSPVGPTAGTDPKTYNDLVQAIVSADADAEELGNRIIQANTDGKLSPDDARKIYQMHLLPNAKSLAESVGDKQTMSAFSKIQAESDDRQRQIAEKNNWFGSAYRVLNNFFYGPDKDKSMTEAMRNLYDNVAKTGATGPQIVSEADKVVAAANLKKHPEWAKLPKEGKKGVDRFGNKVTVYPDGRVVESK